MFESNDKHLWVPWEEQSGATGAWIRLEGRPSAVPGARRSASRRYLLAHFRRVAAILSASSYREEPAPYRVRSTSARTSGWPKSLAGKAQIVLSIRERRKAMVWSASGRMP